MSRTWTGPLPSRSSTAPGRICTERAREESSRRGDAPRHFVYLFGPLGWRAIEAGGSTNYSHLPPAPWGAKVSSAAHMWDEAVTTAVRRPSDRGLAGERWLRVIESAGNGLRRRWPASSRDAERPLQEVGQPCPRGRKARTAAAASCWQQVPVRWAMG